MGGKSGLGSESKKSPIKKDVVKPDQGIKLCIFSDRTAGTVERTKASDSGLSLAPFSTPLFA